MKKYFLPLVALLLGGVAFAIPSNVDKILNLHVGNALWVGTPAQVTTANQVTHLLGGSATINFASATTTCEDSSAITVTGAQVGDACAVGVPASGGSANGAYSCFVSAAGAVKVRHCAVGTADNPDSATFYVRIISSQ